MPKLKKSKCTEFLAGIGENIRICKEIFGIDNVSAVMGVSVNTVHNRIQKPSKFSMKELYRLSEYTDIKPEDFIRPLKLGKGGEK